MSKLSQLFLALILFLFCYGQAWAATPTQLEKYVREAMIYIVWKKPNEGLVQGSGVVFRIPDFREKFVLTAHHVIEDAIDQKIPIMLQSFGMRKGQGQVTDLEGWQVFHDLASYRLPNGMEKIRPLKLSNKILRSGDKVGIYSFPLGNPWKSVGFVKGTMPILIDTPLGQKIVLKYVFSNFVFSGSSGAMMVNSKGQLMGMVTHSVPLSALRRGVTGGLGTPSPLILELIDNAVKNGWRPNRNKEKAPHQDAPIKHLDPFDLEGDVDEHG